MWRPKNNYPVSATSIPLLIFCVHFLTTASSPHRSHRSAGIDYILNTPWARARKWGKYISSLYKPVSSRDGQLINLSGRQYCVVGKYWLDQESKCCFQWWLCHLQDVIKLAGALISGLIFKMGIIIPAWTVLEGWFEKQIYVKISLNCKVLYTCKVL